MDPELIEELNRRIDAGLPARNISERLYYRQRRKGTSALADALVAVGSGPAAFVTSMGSGFAGLARMALPKAVEPEWLRRTQEGLSERSGELSRTGFKANAPLAFASRLGAETAGVLGTVGALTSAGRVGRTGQALRLARPVAPNTLGRTGRQVTGLGALLAGTPSAAVQAVGGEEASTALAISQLLPEDSPLRESVEEAMHDPAKRIASEVAIDVGLGGVMEVIARGIRRLRPGAVQGAEFEAKTPDEIAAEAKATVERGVERRARDLAFGGPEQRLGGDRREMVDPLAELRRELEPEGRPVEPQPRPGGEQDALDNLVAGGMGRDEAEELLGRGRGLPVEPRPTEVAEGAEAAVRARMGRTGDVPVPGGEARRGGRPLSPRGKPKPSGYEIQFNRFGVEPEAAARAEDTFHQLLEEGKIPEPVTITHAETLRAAQAMGVDDIAKGGVNKSLDSVMLTSLRVNFEDNRTKIMAAARRMSEMMKEITEPGLGPTRRGEILDEMDSIERGMLQMEKQNDAFMSMFVTGASEAGRTLNSLKAMARGSSDPFYWLLKLRKIKALASGHDIGRQGNISILRKRNPLPELTQHETDMFDLALNAMRQGDDRAMISLAQSMAGEMGALDKLVQIRRAGLLTGSKTMGRNALSNTVESVLAETSDQLVASIADRLLAPMVSPVRTVPRVRGQTGEVMNVATGKPMRTTLWTPVDRTKAALSGARRGSKKALDVLFRGDDFSKGIEAGVEGDVVARKWDEIQSGKIDRDGPVGTALNWIFDLQGSYDAPFRFAAFWGAIDEQARLLTRHIPANRRAVAIKNLIDNPHPEMVDEAVRQSVERVFANQTKIAELASRMDQFLSEMMRSSRAEVRMGGTLARAAFGILAPFRRTPSSLLTRFAIERAPVVGQVNAILKGYNLRQGGEQIAKLLADNGEITMRQFTELQQLQKEFSTAVGRSSTGTGIVMLGAWLASQGLATGHYPSSTADRDKWRQHGKVPFAIKVGGSWHSLTGVAPFGNLLGYGAQLFVDTEADGFTSGAPQAALGQGQMFMEQSFMRGINELNQAVMDPGRFGEQFISNQAGSFVPTIMSDLAILTDGKLRETRGDNLAQSVGYGVARRLPGVSRTVPARQDVLGKDIPLGVSAAVAPTVPRAEPTDPVGRELVRLDLRIPESSKGAGESREQFRERNRSQGQSLQIAVPQLFGNATFQRLDPEQQQAALTALAQRVRSYVRDNPRGKSSWAADVRRVIDSARR